MWSVLNCLDILSEDKDAATSSTADSLLKNIFCFNFVLGIMVPNSVLISIVYLHLLSTAVPAAAAHLPRAQPEVGAGRGGDQPVRGGDTLGCRVSATMVAVWMLCEKYRFDLANLASVPTSLVGAFSEYCEHDVHRCHDCSPLVLLQCTAAWCRQEVLTPPYMGTRSTGAGPK